MRCLTCSGRSVGCVGWEGGRGDALAWVGFKGKPKGTILAADIQLDPLVEAFCVWNLLPNVTTGWLRNPRRTVQKPWFLMNPR